MDARKALVLRLGLLGFGAIAIALPAGCGQNVCDQAAQHEIDCGIVTESSSSSSGGIDNATDCSGPVECQSGCLSAASCGDLKSYTDPKKAIELRDCLTLCESAAVVQN